MDHILHTGAIKSIFKVETMLCTDVSQIFYGNGGIEENVSLTVNILKCSIKYSSHHSDFVKHFLSP